MKNVIPFLLSFIIIGCGGGGSMVSPQNPDKSDSSTPPVTPPLTSEIKFKTSNTFSVQLSKAQNVPRDELDTNVAAEVKVEIDEKLKKYKAILNAKGMEISSAALFVGQAGKKGIKFADFKKDEKGVFLISETGITDAQLAQFRAGGLYVRVVTSAGDSYRGEVLPENHHLLLFDLTGSQQVPAVESSATASGYATFDANKKTLSVVIDATRFSDITTAKVYAGSIGVEINGTPLFELKKDPNDSNNWVSESPYDLDDTDIARLLSGGLFVSLNSTKNPKGELRGQILPADYSVMAFSLSPKQVIPAEDSTAEGSGYVLLNKKTKAVEIAVVTENITRVSSVKVNSGRLGMNGAEVVSLVQNDANKNLWSVKSTFTDDNVKSLLQGSLYVLAATSTHTNGVLRGQILSSEHYRILAFSLDSAQLVPSLENASSGNGYGAFNLMTKALELRIVTEQLTSTASASAKIHAGAIGQNGDSIYELTPVEGSAGTWVLAAGTTLSSAQATALLAKGLYVRIDTQSNTSGEIRGQMISDNYEVISFAINDEQSVPHTESSSTATGYALVDTKNKSLTLTVNTEGISDVRDGGVRLRSGTVGVNGQVIWTLVKKEDGIWTSADGASLTIEQFQSLMETGLYVTVTSEKDTIRGQVVNGNHEVVFTFELNGKQQIPFVYTAKKATGYISYNKVTSRLNVRVNASTADLANASLYNGRIGLVGTKTVDLIKEQNLQNVSSWYKSFTLDKSLANGLLSGGFYVNVTSDSYSSGEIRGQIIDENYDVLSFSLSARQNVPTAASEASGHGYALIHKAKLTLELRVVTQGINDASSAALNVGRLGIKAITAFLALESLTNAGVVWQTPENTELSSEQLTSLMNGDYYADVKSTSHTNGEIRGQVITEGHSVFAFPLSGTQLVPRSSTDIKGSGYVIIKHEDLAFEARVRLPDGSNVNSVFLHTGKVGRIGGVQAGLVQDSSDTNLWVNSNGAKITQAIFTAMKNGESYFNASTAAAPSGLIRGQILKDNMLFRAMDINGKQNVPSINTSATAQGYAFLNVHTGSFDLLAKTANITSPTTANVHMGNVGREGGTLFGLERDSGDLNIWQTSRVLSASDKAKIASGVSYVNVNTVANPAGEIRGQIVASHKSIFSYELSSSQVVPAVSSSATGTGYVILDGFEKDINGVLRTSDVPNASAAEVHIGSVGENGQLSFALRRDPGDVNLWIPLDDQPPLTSAQIDNLNKGGAYTIVETTGNPDGEIRGQIITDRFQVVTFPLTGAQVVPSVSTSGSGDGYGLINLVDSTIELKVLTNGLTNITAAHMNVGSAGVNGGIASSLTEDTDDASKWFLPSGTSWNPSVGLSGGYYIIVDTQANTSGEIRGQITP